jgi:hypothetical protein
MTAKTLILTRYRAEAENLQRAIRLTDMVATHTAMPVFAMRTGHRFDRIIAAFHPEEDELDCEGQDKRRTRIQAERCALDGQWTTALRVGGRIDHRPLHGVWGMVRQALAKKPRQPRTRAAGREYVFVSGTERKRPSTAGNR